MRLRKVSRKYKSHASVSATWDLSGIKKELIKKKKKKISGGLKSSTSYLTVTGPLLTIQNFCSTEALLDAANL